MNNKVDLMFAYLGNGISVADRSRYEYGDYKKVAHISEYGMYKLYDKNLPSDAIQRIEEMAVNVGKEAYQKWCNMPSYVRYHEIEYHADWYHAYFGYEIVYKCSAKKSFAYLQEGIAKQGYIIPQRAKTIL